MNLISFYRLIPDGIAPQRAGRSAAGTLPARALRYCEPVTSASGFGWYVFLPMEFSVIWDGTEAIWTYPGAADKWYPLRTAQYPRFSRRFDQGAPENCRGFAPPFLTLTDDHAILQIWTGLVARTAPDWSSLYRTPANLPRSQGYDLMEGIVETDRWFGPLFTNVRLIRSNLPIQFRADRPFLQVQPVHRANYAEGCLNAFTVERGVESLTADDWAAYHRTIVVPNTNPCRRHGEYAVTARKRRAGEAIHVGRAIAGSHIQDDVVSVLHARDPGQSE